MAKDRKEEKRAYYLKTREKQLAAAREKYHADLEASRAYEREKYFRNRERSLDYSRKWQSENREKYEAYQAEYRKTDKRKESVKKWDKANPGSVGARDARRRASKISRTPAWLDDDQAWFIKEIYALARLRDKLTGTIWHVDHIVPLQGKTVSGLHVPWNLQVIPKLENLRKSNYI